MSGMALEEIPLYNASNLTVLRNDLATERKSENADERKKRKDLQIQFLQTAENQSPKKFLEYFTDRCKQDDATAAAFRSEPFLEKNLSHPSIEMEQEIYQTLITLPPRLAARPSFWNSYHLEMIQRKIIKPSYLACDYARPSLSGRANLQHALEKRTEKLLFQSVRDILRHMGGLDERGQRSVYTDCSVSRAWWRGFISHQVAKDMKLDLDRVWETLHISTAWTNFMEYSVRKLTVISDRNIRSAFVTYLTQIPEKIRRNKQFNRNFLGKIGERCAYQSLGFLKPWKNLEIFREMYGNDAAGQ